MTDLSVDVASLAEEIHKISHNMRSALSVLQVGAHYLGQTGAEGAETADAMKIKIGQINTACDRLKAISAQLKK